MSKHSLPGVSIFTDGCYLPDHDTGSWACHLSWYLNSKFRACELVKAVPEASSAERMEVMAIVHGLEFLDRPCRATIHTDHQGIVNSMQYSHYWDSFDTWPRWAKNNQDLGRRLLNQLRLHTVNFNWVKGHGRSFANRRCDRLARLSAKSFVQRARKTVPVFVSVTSPFHDGPVWIPVTQPLEVWQL